MDLTQGKRRLGGRDIDNDDLMESMGLLERSQIGLDALDRDSERVRADVSEELVSRLAAREHYGVVFDGEARGELKIDHAATAKLRDWMRSQRKAS